MPMETANHPAAAAPTGQPIEGLPSRGLRLLGMAMPLIVVVMVAWALGYGFAGPAPHRAALVAGLVLAEIVASALLILLGSLVEGFGWGLSLGTEWPYTRNIVLRMWRGDPEAAHRLLATAVGLLALALVILQPGAMSWTGLGLVAATALFGMGTLYVLSGRAPALVHGVHGLLAYLVFLTFLAGRAYPAMTLLQVLAALVALHSILFAVFMGGMVTGQRGFGRPIEPFVRPRRPAQWVFLVHGFAALLVVGTLGWFSAIYPVAFLIAVVQAAVGFFQFQQVNLRPRAPGVIVALHQLMALLMTAAVVFAWRL